MNREKFRDMDKTEFNEKFGVNLTGTVKNAHMTSDRLFETSRFNVLLSGTK